MSSTPAHDDDDASVSCGGDAMVDAQHAESLDTHEAKSEPGPLRRIAYADTPEWSA